MRRINWQWLYWGGVALLVLWGALWMGITPREVTTEVNYLPTLITSESTTIFFYFSVAALLIFTSLILQRRAQSNGGIARSVGILFAILFVGVIVAAIGSAFGLTQNRLIHISRTQSANHVYNLSYQTQPYPLPGTYVLYECAAIGWSCRLVYPLSEEAAFVNYGFLEMLHDTSTNTIMLQHTVDDDRIFVYYPPLP
jgi:hypothetical protein